MVEIQWVGVDSLGATVLQVAIGDSGSLCFVICDLVWLWFMFHVILYLCAFLFNVLFRVWPPARHKMGGKRHTWLNGRAIKRYTRPAQKNKQNRTTGGVQDHDAYYNVWRVTSTILPSTSDRTESESQKVLSIAPISIFVLCHYDGRGSEHVRRTTFTNIITDIKFFCNTTEIASSDIVLFIFRFFRRLLAGSRSITNHIDNVIVFRT
jgi:hypothetical protein